MFLLFVRFRRFQKKNFFLLFSVLLFRIRVIRISSFVPQLAKSRDGFFGYFFASQTLIQLLLLLFSPTPLTTSGRLCVTSPLFQRRSRLSRGERELMRNEIYFIVFSFNQRQDWEWRSPLRRSYSHNQVEEWRSKISAFYLFSLKKKNWLGSSTAFARVERLALYDCLRTNRRKRSRLWLSFCFGVFCFFFSSFTVCSTGDASAAITSIHLHRVSETNQVRCLFFCFFLFFSFHFSSKTLISWSTEFAADVASKVVALEQKNYLQNLIVRKFVFEMLIYFLFIQQDLRASFRK